MAKFTYPAEKFDERNLDKNIILKLVKKHEGMVAGLIKNEEYYKGHHAIEGRKRDKDSPNNKVSCNHAKDIADTASGYFMGNPITYSNTGEEDIEPLIIAFDEANVDDVDADNALDMSIGMQKKENRLRKLRIYHPKIHSSLLMIPLRRMSLQEFTTTRKRTQWMIHMCMWQQYPQRTSHMF